MNELVDSIFVMVDDNVDEIFLTRRQMRKQGIVNRFISEKKPEKLFETLEHIKMTTDGRTEFIIIVDINMPRCNGFELLDLIRAHDAYRETPVIMLSVSDDESDIFEAFERGANGYVVKPFSSDEFFAALSNVPSVKQQIVQ